MTCEQEDADSGGRALLCSRVLNRHSRHRHLHVAAQICRKRINLLGAARMAMMKQTAILIQHRPPGPPVS